MEFDSQDCSQNLHKVYYQFIYYSDHLSLPHSHHPDITISTLAFVFYNIKHKSALHSDYYDQQLMASHLV
jgi:hypothetical protein